MKMYILVRDDVPLGFAMVTVAHASLAAYREPPPATTIPPARRVD